MRHTTCKVVQGQIISRVKKGKVVDQVAGTKKNVNVIIYKLSLIMKYRLVQMDRVVAEVMANPGYSVDKQKFKKFEKCEEFLFLFFSSSTRRDPGVYHAVTAAVLSKLPVELVNLRKLGLEHIVSHAMGFNLFLWESS